MVLVLVFKPRISGLITACAVGATLSGSWVLGATGAG